MIGIGTLANALAIIIGSLVGIGVGSRFSDRYQKILIQAMGLTVLLVGASMALKVTDIMLVGGSMALGALVGEWIDIEGHVKALSKKVKSMVGSKHCHFNEGFVVATLLYCIGSMAILGAIEDGINSNPTILYAKGMLDGFISIALASTLGIGVLFSFFPVLVYQGGITFLAFSFGDIASEQMIQHLSATGGLMIVCLGLNLLEITKIKVGNFLPALLFAAIFSTVV